MKLLVSLAVASAVTNAAPQSGWHVRVHMHAEKKGVSETCYAPGGSIACQDDLMCVQISDWYGACMKKQPELNDQCGGHSVKGPWKNPCASTPHGVNSTCVFISPYFSQCQDLTHREQYRFKRHSSSGHATQKGHAAKDHDASQPIPLYGQCKWADASAKCAVGLQCITESDHYGQCRKLEAALYEQCGGKTWKEPWNATCESKSVCVKRDEWYSQCLPDGTPATASPATDPTTTQLDADKSTTPTAGKWEQCGGASFHGSTVCVGGTTCVKHGNWYSQCKPDKLPVGELCAENKRDSTWTHASCEGSAKCVTSTPDGSESRCEL